MSVRTLGPTKKARCFGYVRNEWVDPGTGNVSLITIDRRSDMWRQQWQHKTFFLVCWWNTRQWRVLVTLPCGCQILKNCKRPAVCGKCLRQVLMAGRG